MTKKQHLFAHYRINLDKPNAIVITTCKRSLRRLSFYRCVSVHREACIGGVSVAGGMRGRGAYMVGVVHGRGGMHGRGWHVWQGGVCGRGACMAGEVHDGGLHGRGA